MSDNDYEDTDNTEYEKTKEYERKERNNLICYYITISIVFFGSWIYCISEYGYLLGVGLGWLPSMIATIIVGVLWPFLPILWAILAILLLIFLYV